MNSTAAQRVGEKEENNTNNEKVEDKTPNQGRTTKKATPEAATKTGTQYRINEAKRVGCEKGEGKGGEEHDRNEKKEERVRI